MIQIAQDMPDVTPAEVLLVPDFRTILDLPKLEDWKFSPFPAFTIVLPQALLCEFEELRNCASDQATWKKYTAAICQLQDCGRRSRGSKTALPGDVNITLSVRPLEPVFDDAVSWLDPESSEDRTVARVVSLVREHPRCVVALVTKDAKLQDRADESRVETIVPTAPAGHRDSD
jgi:predicted ribonuclease YlaK